jgi:hypothetical protein
MANCNNATNRRAARSLTALSESDPKNFFPNLAKYFYLKRHLLLEQTVGVRLNSTKEAPK